MHACPCSASSAAFLLRFRAFWQDGHVGDLVQWEMQSDPRQGAEICDLLETVCLPDLSTEGSCWAVPCLAPCGCRVLQDACTWRLPRDGPCRASGECWLQRCFLPLPAPRTACQRTAPSSPSGVTGATWPSLRITLSVTIILFGVQI